MEFNLQNPPEGANENSNPQSGVATLSTLGEIAAADGGMQSKPASDKSEPPSPRGTLSDNMEIQSTVRNRSTGHDGAFPKSEDKFTSAKPKPPSRESNIPKAENYNLRSPAVKRLLREAQELSREPNNDFKAVPLEDNLFEWHFTIRGPSDSEFSHGIYHGRIIMPPEYPMKPPAIMMLTPNGRFETGTKICLSISNYHPETWRPSWSIRTALMALISFMATPSPGAIGSLECTPEVRRNLARRSLGWICPTCGPILDDITHEHPVPEDTSPPAQRVFRLAHEHDTSELHDSVAIADDVASEPHIPIDEPLTNLQAGDTHGLGHQIHQANMDMNVAADAVEDNTAFTICVGLLVFTIAALVFRRVYLSDFFQDTFEF